MFSKKDLRIRAMLAEERRQFVEAKLPTSREDLNKLDQSMMKMFMACKGYEMQITVIPPNYDSESGSYRIKIIHSRGEVIGGGVHLYDAIYMAQAKLHDLITTPEIKVIEVSSIPDITGVKKKISLDDIDL